MHVLLFVALIIFPTEGLSQILGVRLADITFLHRAEKVLYRSQNFKLFAGDLPFFEIGITWVLLFKREIQNEFSELRCHVKGLEK